MAIPYRLYNNRRTGTFDLEDEVALSKEEVARLQAQDKKVPSLEEQLAQSQTSLEAERTASKIEKKGLHNN